MGKAASSPGPKPIQKVEGSQFRSWLIEKVSLSRWMIYKDDTDEEIAQRIGVTLDVLEEAKKVYAERVAYEGLPDGQKLGHRTVFGRNDKREIFLEPPRAIYDEVAARAERQQLTHSVLLRSIMHFVLQTKTQPLWLAERKRDNWIFRGEWLGAKNIRRDRYRLVTTLSEGADLALRLRAEKTHVSIRSLCRWGVCLYVNGQLDQSGYQLKIVSSAHQMYKKPEQYCLAPKIIP